MTGNISRHHRPSPCSVQAAPGLQQLAYDSGKFPALCSTPSSQKLKYGMHISCQCKAKFQRQCGGIGWKFQQRNGAEHTVSYFNFWLDGVLISSPFVRNGFVPGCQEYDRHIRKIPYLLHQKETVSVRQHDIQDCKVRFFGFGGLPYRPESFWLRASPLFSAGTVSAALHRIPGRSRFPQ